MAYERKNEKEIRGEGLDAFVSGRLKMYSTQITARNAEDEMSFNRAVLEENLPLSDQLNYRKEQLKRVADDPVERKRIRAEISSLTDRIEMKAYSDEYLGKLVDFERGVTSIDSVISWLNTRKAGTTDLAIKESIDKILVEQEKARFNIQKNVLENQTKYAVADKTEAILETQIGKIQSSRNQALLAGNTELVSSLDLQLQSLNKAKNEASIENDIKSFSVATMSGASNSLALLDNYNQKISSASQNSPITIGGITYSSPKEFWTFKRDTYISDESANGFFSRLKDEKAAEIKQQNSNNLLSSNSVKQAASVFDSLTGRVELQPFANKILNSKTEVLQTGVDYRSASVYNQYLADNDVNKALGELTSLKNMGANVDDAYAKIITKAASIKSEQVSNILSTTQQLLQKNPGMTPEQAIQQAVSSGAGSTLSPEQLVTKDEQKIAQEQAAGSKAGAFTPNPATTTNPGNVNGVPPPVVPGIPQINDLSSRYGKAKGGNAIFDKSTGVAFGNETDFFKSAGVQSFKDLKLDDAYTPFYKYDNDATVYNAVTNQALDYDSYIKQGGAADFNPNFVQIRKRK